MPGSGGADDTDFLHAQPKPPGGGILFRLGGIARTAERKCDARLLKRPSNDDLRQRGLMCFSDGGDIGHQGGNFAAIGLREAWVIAALVVAGELPVWPDFARQQPKREGGIGEG